MVVFRKVNNIHGLCEHGLFLDLHQLPLHDPCIVQFRESPGYTWIRRINFKSA